MKNAFYFNYKAFRSGGIQVFVFLFFPLFLLVGHSFGG